MEKRISFFQFQSVKAVAKAIDPKLREMDTLKKKEAILKEEAEAKFKKLKEEIEKKKQALDAEVTACKTQIDALEAGIVATLGFKVTELVKKVIEPTGKTDAKTGKPIKVTKYIPTDIVSYDEAAKEFVVTTPDPDQPDHDMPAGTEESVVPPTTDGAGSDYDKDAETLSEQQEAIEEVNESTETGSDADNLPW